MEVYAVPIGKDMSVASLKMYESKRRCGAEKSARVSRRLRSFEV
jgi:hypothetical protein